MSQLRDLHARPLSNLRVSVTDRCNLRCAYCMPEAEYEWLPNSKILSFEETALLVDQFLALGVHQVRLTGGEPLIRRELPELVRQLAQKSALQDLSLTTNGVLLAEQAAALHSAGLHRLTVSLDTLKADRFQALTRRDSLPHVIEGIEAAARVGFRKGLKLDAVVIRGTNDDELVELLRFAAQVKAELRFIEYMDVGGATRWSREAVVSQQQMLEAIETAFGPVTALQERSSAPAKRFRLASGQHFGIIASTTQPFCGQCDRARLTADGTFFTCLYATEGLNLRDALRSGADAQALKTLIADRWAQRSDRGAEQRLQLRDARGPLRNAHEMRRDPLLEMHVRGG